MKKTNLYLVLISLYTMTLAHAQTNYKTLLKDFQRISGSWTGSLTYLDYSSGKPYTMPADLVIKRIGPRSQFAFSNSYPNEKSANSTDTLFISTDGKFIDGAKLVAGDVIEVGEEIRIVLK